MQCFDAADKQVLVSNVYSQTETVWIFVCSFNVSTALGVKYKSTPTQKPIMSEITSGASAMTLKQCFSHPGLWTEVQGTSNNMSIQQRSFQCPLAQSVALNGRRGPKINFSTH